MVTSTHLYEQHCILSEDNQGQQGGSRYRPLQWAKEDCDQQNASVKSRVALSLVHTQDTCAFLLDQLLQSHPDMSVESHGHDALDFAV